MIILIGKCHRHALYKNNGRACQRCDKYLQQDHLLVHTVRRYEVTFHSCRPALIFILQDVLAKFKEIRVPPIINSTLYVNSYYTKVMEILVQSVVYTFSEGFY